MKLTYLAGLKMDDLKREVANLGENAIVCAFISLLIRRQGRFLFKSKVFSSNRPVVQSSVYGISGSILVVESLVVAYWTIRRLERAHSRARAACAVGENPAKRLG